MILEAWILPSKSLKIIDSFNSSSNDNAKIKRKRPAPYSLRLSDAERKYLDNKAGDMSLHSYIRARIFDDDAPLPSKRKQPRVSDMQALSKVLGTLGRSNTSNNLNQIAKAIHHGNFNMPDGVLVELNAACREITAMRADLIVALGLKERQS